MKTIFLSSFHALISRNMLTAGVLKRLTDQGLRVVLLVPLEKVEYFEKTFGGERVLVEGVELPKVRMVHLFQLISLGLVGVENHIVRGWKTQRHYLKYYAAQAIYMLCSRFFIFHRLFRAVARWYFHTKALDALFARYRPDLVVATDSFDQMDRVLLLEAERQGVRTVGCIRSWDNATTKGVFLPKVNRMIVPNEVLKEEMHHIHRIPLSGIHVVGIPHYDSVTRPRSTSWEALCKETGLNPSKKTIFYSPGGKILYRHDNEVLKLLQRHLTTGDFGENVQCLVSIQPGDDVDTASVTGDPNFIIYTFGTRVTARRKENELAPNENERLNDFLYFSDVLVTLGSTMAIDATVFNKPAIVLGFDPAPGLSDPMSKFAKYVHLKKFIDTGWITVAYSDAELVQQMRTYLADPASGKEKRAALAARYAYKLDGRSAERMASAIRDELSEG